VAMPGIPRKQRSAGLAAPFSPLFGAATKYSWRCTLRLLAKDGGLRNSRTAPSLVYVIYADRLCHW
jgi:hypothetical protein